MSTYTVRTLTSTAEMEALQPAWTCLYQASRAANPFAHPLWMTTWARHFAGSSPLRIVTVYDEGGALVGVAPFYLRRYQLAAGMAVASLQLLGTGQHVEITELTQVLTQPGSERPIMRAIMHQLCEHSHEWDWAEVVLPPEQGWFEPQWIPQKGAAAGSFILHKATRACVVLPLLGSWDDLRARLKRNVKESIRHGTNSLKREGHCARFIVPDSPDDFATALDQFIALHRKRSVIEGKVRHADQLAKPSDRAFLRDVAGRMFRAGHLTPCILDVNGVPAAARLLLQANGSAFFSLSGFDPAWWPYSVATTLMSHCLQYAIERGSTMANLSPGPDVAKLRWSEQLELHQEFLVVGPRRRSRLAFSLYWQLRAAAAIRRESRRHEES
jgi:CelD/BcsL family acetyltransferase involved in cellulose biosynthesis